MKVALVTGVSSGIGKQTALQLLHAGYIVYGGARNIDKVRELEDLGIRLKVLDVTSKDSMDKVVNCIIKCHKRIDVLVNNAGYGLYGPVEYTSMEKIRDQFEVNVFGLIYLTKLVLPYMRNNQYGKIVNISSMGGRIWTPMGAFYHSTKYAVEGLSHSMRLEVEPFGIDVILIQPGGIKTNWGNIAANNLEEVGIDTPYEKQCKTISEGMKKTYRSKLLTSPSTIARCIVKAVTVKKPKTKYLLGYGAKPLVVAHRVFGDRTYDKIIKKTFGRS